MELNPKNPVTIATRDQWHKIAALILHKLSPGGEVVITAEDIMEVQNSVIVCHDKIDGLHIYLTDSETGKQMAKHGVQP